MKQSLCGVSLIALSLAWPGCKPTEDEPANGSTGAQGGASGASPEDGAGSGGSAGAAGGSGGKGSAGSGATAGKGGSGEMPAAGSTGMGTESDPCSDLEVSDVLIETSLVEEPAPDPKGGADTLPGTYDLYSWEIYGEGNPDAGTGCEGFAKIDKKFDGQMRSYRFTALSDGNYLVELALLATGQASADVSFTATLTDGIYLDPVEGTEQCEHLKTGADEKTEREIYSRGPDFLGYSAIETFTSEGDDLTIIAGASFSVDNVAYCSRVYRLRRR